MEPLDSYTKIQPLVQHDIDLSMEKFASDRKYDVANIPAHTHTGKDSNKVDFSDLDNRKRFIVIRVLGSSTSTSISSTIGGDFVMPLGGYITGAVATVDTAGTTNPTTVDVKKNNTSIFTTKITIDSGSKTSRSAATPMVLNPSQVNFSVGDIITIDITTISTTAAKGLTVTLTAIETTP